MQKIRLPFGASFSVSAFDVNYIALNVMRFVAVCNIEAVEAFGVYAVNVSLYALFYLLKIHLELEVFVSIGAVADDEQPVCKMLPSALRLMLVVPIDHCVFAYAGGEVIGVVGKTCGINRNLEVEMLPAEIKINEIILFVFFRVLHRVPQKAARILLRS